MIRHVKPMCIKFSNEFNIFCLILFMHLTGFSGFENMSWVFLRRFILQPEQSLSAVLVLEAKKILCICLLPFVCVHLNEQLLTSLFKGEGATSCSQEVDLLEPCPSAIVSLLILCPLRKHRAAHGDSLMSEFSLQVFFSSISRYISPTGKQLRRHCL